MHVRTIGYICVPTLSTYGEVDPFCFSSRQFWEVPHRLTVDKGLVMMDRRIVIPTSFKKRILRCLHSAHQGCNGMHARANISLYWPGT